MPQFKLFIVLFMDLTIIFTQKTEKKTRKTFSSPFIVQTTAEIKPSKGQPTNICHMQVSN